MLIVADKQILCATCGALVGLLTHRAMPVTVLKDRYVASADADRVFFCNIQCKEKAQV